MPDNLERLIPVIDLNWSQEKPSQVTMTCFWKYNLYITRPLKFQISYQTSIKVIRSHFFGVQEVKYNSFRNQILAIVLTLVAMETKTHLDKELLSLSIDFDPVEPSVCQTGRHWAERFCSFFFVQVSYLQAAWEIRGKAIDLKSQGICLIQ